MKGLPCVVASLCVASVSAYGRSSVTLYGIVDKGITYTASQRGNGSFLRTLSKRTDIYAAAELMKAGGSVTAAQIT
ncbi:hypothetical protein AYM40_04835 [Paraburkholderia phytofirmans OLGA172]|jgi:predicted porin|uniref:Porin domain-containing protein n=1 Tax=Paraburkholderia phytofirmans OLGA172 TaxID=1417228 RepID=A0A160FI57_9BURK|nr:hypothetical protein [Paraburkholderia phytofirmans]ANB71774.1 hypothetical protein AYM40_04835 [Paraburkholderia phytofirmans OLGA172]